MGFKTFIFLMLCCLERINSMSKEMPFKSDPKSDFKDVVHIKTTLEFIAENGYEGKQYTVETKDGYILAVHRIAPKEGSTPKNIPVFLMHGLLDSSPQWVMYGPNSLGFLLADEGYEVFLGDSRGNRYSDKHATYPPHSPKYWNFTWHEMGLYDLPAMIDFVLETSGKEQIYYVGHSQGTTQYFVMDSLLDGYEAKVKTMFALAPIAFMKHATSPPLVILSQIQQPVSTLTQLIGLNVFIPQDGAINLLGGAICREQVPVIPEVCENIFFLISGFEDSQFNKSILTEVLHQVPAGCSTKDLLHYGQSIDKGTFAPYNYGIISNLLEYGSEEPPSYPLHNAKTEYFFFTASNDLLSNIIDVEKLASYLPNLRETYHVPYEKFSHMDYLWAIDVKELVYDVLIAEINKG